MLEPNYLKKAVQRFGVSVNVTTGSDSRTVKAFMQPLRARRRLYLSTKLDGLDISSEKVETETMSYTWAVFNPMHKITTEVV